MMPHAGMPLYGPVRYKAQYTIVVTQHKIISQIKQANPRVRWTTRKRIAFAWASCNIYFHFSLSPLVRRFDSAFALYGYENAGIVTTTTNRK